MNLQQQRLREQRFQRWLQLGQVREWMLAKGVQPDQVLGVVLMIREDGKADTPTLWPSTLLDLGRLTKQVDHDCPPCMAEFFGELER